jgi:dihydroorotase
MKSTSTPTDGCAAGIYTSPILLPLVAHLLESFGALDKLEGFVSGFGRAFYGREVAGDVPTTSALSMSTMGKVGESGRDVVVLRKVSMERGRVIDERYLEGEESVVPFWSGRAIGWEIVEGEK